MKQKGIIILLLLAICLNGFGQPKTKSNLEIFEETVSGGIEKLFYYPGVDRERQFIFIIYKDLQRSGNRNDDQVKFLANILKKTASNDKLKFSIAYDSVSSVNDTLSNIIEFRPVRMETAYPGFKKNKFLGEKTLVRRITAEIQVTVTGNNKRLLSNNINIVHTDEVKYDNYESLENSPYTFTHAAAPEIGQLESIFFPLVLITASAVATVLFFIIRTK